MDNKYLYLSSLGSSNHSDFTVQFPNAIKIKPYSQVRLLSCRINPNDSMLTVDDTNNVFYMGLDFWNKFSAVMPLMPVVMKKGTYALVDGDDNNLYLISMLDEVCNKAFKRFCHVRGGITHSINSNQHLTVKASAMQMYGCPTIELTDEALRAWTDTVNVTRAVVTKEDANGNNINYAYADPSITDEKIDTDFNGVKYESVNSPTYFISSGLVTGLTGAGEDSPFVSHIFEIDLRNFNFANDNEFIQIWNGLVTAQGFYDEKLYNSWGNGMDTRNFKSVHRYALQISSAGVVIIMTDTKDNGILAVTKYIITGSFNRKIRLKVTEWEEDDGVSHYNITVTKSSDGTTYTESFNKDAYCNTYSQKSTLTTGKVRLGLYEQNRVGLLLNISSELEDKILFTCAVDDVNDKIGFNTTTGEFGGRSSLNTNVKRPLTMVTDFGMTKGQTTRLTEEMINQMENIQSGADFENPLRHSYGLVLGYPPTADILSYDADDDSGFSGTPDPYNTYSTGLVAQGHVKVNNKDFPQAYLEIRDLPLKNYSASYLSGKINKFISPIDFSESQTSNRLYTSKVYTEQFLTLSNSQEMNLSSMTVKICDINGVAMDLDKYTIVTIEVRDNPYLKEQEHREKLINGLRDTFVNAPRPQINNAQ